MKIALFEKIHDNSIQILSGYGEVIDLSRLKDEDKYNNLDQYDAVFVKSVTKVDRDFINKAINLKFVGRPGTGVDNIDLNYLKEKNIIFANSPTANSVSTAEYTLCLIFILLRNIPDTIRFIDKHDFRRHRLEGRELGNMAVGIVGLGNVGMNLAKRLQGFGCKIYGYDRTEKNKKQFEILGGTFYSNIDDLNASSDIVSMHITLNKQTRDFANKNFFSSMKHGSYFINTSRGAIVNDTDLLTFLNNGHIVKAALDVIEPEPPYDLMPESHDYKNDLINHPSVFYSPHIGASTAEAQEQMAMDVVNKFSDFSSKYSNSIKVVNQ